MRSRPRSLALAAALAGAGCGQVALEGERIVVGYQWRGAVAFAAIGVALLAAALRLLPRIREIVGRRASLRGQIRAAAALVGLVPLGAMCLLVAAAWASYRLELDADGVRVSGLPLRGEWTWQEVETFEWRQGNRRRLYLAFRDGRHLWVNEANLGGSAFDELQRALAALDREPETPP